MNSIIKRAFLNALGTVLYIILVVSLIFSFQNGPDTKTILIPIAMLSLFVCSAAITGFLVFGKPAMLYTDGKKKEGLAMLGYTIGILALFTIIAFILLIIYL